MNRFHIIDDAVVILRNRGVYHQAKLYRRGEELFAGWRGGFVALHGNSGTSAPDVSWLDLDPAGLVTVRGLMNRPMLRPGDNPEISAALQRP